MVPPSGAVGWARRASAIVLVTGVVGGCCLVHRGRRPLVPEAQWPCLPTRTPERWGVGRIRLISKADVDGCGASLEGQVHELRLFRPYLRFEVSPPEDEAILTYECRGVVRAVAELTETGGAFGPIRYSADRFYADLPSDLTPSRELWAALETSLRTNVPEARSMRVEGLSRYRSVVVRDAPIVHLKPQKGSGDEPHLYLMGVTAALPLREPAWW
jgi:hypothetical protein